MADWRRNRGWALLVGLVLILAALASQAFSAEGKPLKGVALVIGEARYEHLPVLRNTLNDARAVGSLLTDLGFDVETVSDGDAKKLKKGLRRFLEDAADADVALIYYSGHGIEAGGEDYLIPIDADVFSLDDAGEKLVALSKITGELQSEVKVAIVLVDACRSNPFPPAAKLKRLSSPEGVAIGSQGLAAIKGAVALDGKAGNSESFGEVLGFAAAPGQPALDGEPGANSPYATALLKHLAANRAYDFGQVMTLVAEEVYLATQGRQRPWTNASLRRFLEFGRNPEEDSSDEALIRDTRRKLLVTIAATPDDLRRTLETLANEKHIPLAGMYDVLRAFGRSDIPQDPEKLDRLLALQAETIAKMMAERRALDAADPAITRLATLADQAIDEGALPAARKFLDEAKAKVEQGRAAVENQRERLKAKDASDAAVMARSAEAFIRDFDYLAAANDYAKAYSYVELSNPGLAFIYKLEEADARSAHGDRKGDNEALRQAIEAYGAALKMSSGDRDRRALANNNLGIALRRLGERETGTEDLARAIAVFEATVLEYPRERVPLDWARIQFNLGNVLEALGERESGTESLTRAIAAFEAASSELTRARVPLDWAAIEDSLGSAFAKLGDREKGTESLTKAVAAFKAALSEYTRERAPLDWARTQNNLGAALEALGAREKGVENLVKAIEADRAALAEYTRERFPLRWAMTEYNLGLALASLGERESGSETLTLAVEAFESALAERTHERVPLDWAKTQSRLGKVLLTLGERESGTQSLTRAIAAFESAGTEFPLDRVPLYFAQNESDLG